MSLTDKNFEKSVLIQTKTSQTISVNETHENTIWGKILNEKQNLYNEVNEYIERINSNQPVVPEHPTLKYMNEQVFPLLLPILEKTLKKAILMECLKHQKSLFNGIDFISEQLWTLNPKYPERQLNKNYIFLFPWVKEWLRTHPRQIFPKSWIWTRDQATLKIQSFIRGYNIRKMSEVQEMRQFWKTLIKEKQDKLKKRCSLFNVDAKYD